MGGLGRTFIGSDEIIKDDSADQKDVEQKHHNEHAGHAAVRFVLIPLALFSDGGDLVAMLFSTEEIAEKVRLFLLFLYCGFRFHGVLGCGVLRFERESCDI